MLTSDDMLSPHWSPAGHHWTWRWRRCLGCSG